MVGEAIKRLQQHDPQLLDGITGARQIVDVRNVVVHGYDVIDYRRVWNIVDKMLPILRSEVESILSGIEENEVT